MNATTLAAGFMKPHILLGLLVLCIWTAPVAARAEETCGAAAAQGLIRQGFQALDARRWQVAHQLGDELASYGFNCDDNFAVQNSISVYRMYFYAVSLHGMGDDVHAVEAMRAGVAILEQLKKQGGYTSLYDSMLPLFVGLKGIIPGA